MQEFGWMVDVFGAQEVNVFKARGGGHVRGREWKTYSEQMMEREEKQSTGGMLRIEGQDARDEE